MTPTATAQPKWPEPDSLTPFYESPPRATPATRRMLLVFFEFAPSPAVGTLRWLRMARFAHDRGWAIDVVMLHPSFLPKVDVARLHELPPGVRLFGFADPSVTSLRREQRVWRLVRPLVRRLVGSGSSGGDGTAPSAPVTSASRTAHHAPTWLRSLAARQHLARLRQGIAAASQFGERIASRERYDVIVSSGPPHGAHVAARRIAERAGVPHVVDMRDPWAHEEVVPREFDSPTWRRVIGDHESSTLRAARLVVVTTEALRDALAETYPELGERLITVRNGADRETMPPSRAGSRFVIAFAGDLYVGRDPRGLFRAAATAARRLRLTPEQFGVEFIGSGEYEGVALTKIAEECRLSEFFRSGPSRSRALSLEFLAGASMLVSLPQDVSLAIPAKVYEYAQFDAWILALAEPRSATARLLAGSDADVVSPDDEEAIAKAIAQRVEQFRAGARPTSLNRDGRFDRAPEADRLLSALERVASEH